MKKVFMMAALVLACTVGSKANAMSEPVLNASQSELMPVKKTTKKTTTTDASTSTSKSTVGTAVTGLLGGLLGGSSSNSDSSASSSSSTTGNAVTGLLGGLLGGSSNSSSSSSSSSSSVGGLLGGLLSNVIGSGSFTTADLCANTWRYSKPGCAFESENLLAKAGGSVAATAVENKLSTYYNKIGFSNSNTNFTFKTDGTFTAQIDGKSWSGTYTFDESTHAIKLKGLILSISGYATKSTSGVSLLFEAKKLLTLIKTLSAFSGNSTLSAVTSIASSYNGIRVGFDLTK